MKPVLAALALLALACSSPGPPTELDDLFARAKEAGKPVVLDFGASWCGPCRTLEEEVWPDPEVRAELENFLFVKLDVDEYPDVAAWFRVTGVPDVRVLSADREELARLVGWSPSAGPDRMVRFLREARSPEE